MTLKEFNDSRFGANMFVMYQGENHYVISLDFEEALFGLVPDKKDYNPEEWRWVRCENVVIISE
jgi:hypothetical protein